MALVTPEIVLAEIRRLLVEVVGSTRHAEPFHHLGDDLLLDSLGLMTLASGLEETFDVVLAEEGASRVRTVEDLVSFVLESVGEGSTS